jgi:peptidoglycan/LPS O-acetylase OafA/YrhL
MKAREGYFPELESLRGVAILLVFFFHADGLLSPGHATGILEPIPLGFLRAGHVGVDLFFVLSGFLLGRPFLAAAAAGQTPSIGRYAERRALRILPLYWVAVVTSAILAARTWPDVLRAVPHLFFLNAVAGWSQAILPYSIPWWSLSTEVQFYVLLPLLMTALRHRVLGSVFLLVYGLLYLTFHTGWWHMGSIDGQILLRRSIFGRGPLFLCGIAAAWVHVRYGETLRRRLAASAWVRGGGADVGLLLIYGALAYLLRWVAFWGFPDAENGRRHMYHAIAGVLWALVVLVMLLAPLRSRRLWSNPVLGWIGILSYSLYLLHLPILHRVLQAPASSPPGWTPTTTALVLVLLAGCLALSAVTYRLIERPFLVRKARLPWRSG